MKIEKNFIVYHSSSSSHSSSSVSSHSSSPLNIMSFFHLTTSHKNNLTFERLKDLHSSNDVKIAKGNNVNHAFGTQFSIRCVEKKKRNICWILTFLCLDKISGKLVFQWSQRMGVSPIVYDFASHRLLSTTLA